VLEVLGLGGSFVPADEEDKEGDVDVGPREAEIEREKPCIV